MNTNTHTELHYLNRRERIAFRIHLWRSARTSRRCVRHYLRTGEALGSFTPYQPPANG